MTVDKDECARAWIAESIGVAKEKDVEDDML